MNIKLHIYDQNNQTYFLPKWKLGSCYGPQKFFSFNNFKFETNMTYMERCCLTPGNYTLICENEIGPFGWVNSFIEILGQRYCDDFVGFKGLRRIVVPGKNQMINKSLKSSIILERIVLCPLFNI